MNMVDELLSKDTTSKQKPVEKVKPKKQENTPMPIIGDRVKFFDEQNREFKGIVEKVSGRKCNIRVSRLRGHSQVYLGVPQSTNKKLKPRFN